MNTILKILGLLLIFGLVLSSCANDDESGNGGVTPPVEPPETGTFTSNISVDGLDREYILYVPASYDHETATPLVFNFHGYTSNATEQMFYGDFRTLADAEGFIIVHPQGTIDSQGNPHFNVGWGSSTVNDVNFAEALIDEIAAEYNINAERIYSTGMSNGGFMSYELACQLSGRIAAIASVTGSMSPNQFSTCAPSRAVPVLQIHGTEDGTVGYDGTTFISESIPNVVNYWVTHNSCDTDADLMVITDIDTNDGSTVEHFVYDNGTNEVNVELFKVTGGGHTWPGAAINVGVTNKDINATQEIWDFFSRYDINGKIQ